MRFSNNLLETLQSSAETDSTRDKALEIHIQERVASELRRLEERESEILKSLDQQAITTAASGETKDEDELDRNKVQAELDALRLRLKELPKVLELEGEMKAAREGVVQCLRRKWVAFLPPSLVTMMTVMGVSGIDAC